MMTSGTMLKQRSLFFLWIGGHAEALKPMLASPADLRLYIQAALNRATGGLISVSS
jgi:hypothetical protein